MKKILFALVMIMALLASGCSVEIENLDNNYAVESVEAEQDDGSAEKTAVDTAAVETKSNTRNKTERQKTEQEREKIQICKICKSS